MNVEFRTQLSVEIDLFELSANMPWSTRRRNALDVNWTSYCWRLLDCLRHSTGKSTVPALRNSANKIWHRFCSNGAFKELTMSFSQRRLFVKKSDHWVDRIPTKRFIFRGIHWVMMMIEAKKLDGTNEENQSARRSLSRWLTKVKYYYDRYNCRYVASLIFLIGYAVFGAWLFYLLEHENEKRMKTEEAFYLQRLRNKTAQKIVGDFFKERSHRFAEVRYILLWYENELQSVKLPDALQWDMWGALFYVLGYGNIFPRTVAGRALSVAYAIIGIPLVLAILARFGRFLEQTIARAWIRHRENIKKAQRETRRRLMSGRKHEPFGSNMALSPEIMEAVTYPMKRKILEVPGLGSRTIPVWLALLICLSWICICAGVFLIWEKKWTFFTSLYFFFISLSTIGLGDVVPDHPHMLILMFWLVIAGLSIVSMLLTVIQIKIEEWIYNFMKKMQEEYKRSMELGEQLDREEIRKRALKDEPFLMKYFAMELVSDDKMKKIEEKAEQFERIMSDMNNKNIQADLETSTVFGTPNEENMVDSMACEPMSNSTSPAAEKKLWSRQASLLLDDEHPVEKYGTNNSDTISDVTSFPLDTLRVETINELPTDITHKESQATISQIDFDELIEHLEDLQYFRLDKLLDCYACVSMRPQESYRIQSVSNGMDDTICRTFECDTTIHSSNTSKSQKITDEQATQVPCTSCGESISHDLGTVTEYDPCDRDSGNCRHEDTCSHLTNGVEISTQYSPPTSPVGICRLRASFRKSKAKFKQRARRGLQSTKDRENHAPTKDTDVQTDNSYLKNARRLEQYRSMRTKFLPVFAASPNPHMDNTFKFYRPSAKPSSSVDVSDVQRKQLVTNYLQKLRNIPKSADLYASGSSDHQLETVSKSKVPVSVKEECECGDGY
ncbi:hypothetical protein KIN20_000178 [Parelaphostrongylus tenuis]|uniref:Potassium channel domain-containing protein n=1 Tax=Parelaphostrongylus tenuis TaxID=148309 RepID=A0AAD5LUD7_PARTN|nr:hypothetical protein KIN20_000178 [Parelaphostrongylus tenuis]